MKTKLTNIVLLAMLLISTSLLAKDEAFLKMLEDAKKVAGEVEPVKLMKMIDDGDDVIILDIREMTQRDEGLIYVDSNTPLTIHQITRGNLEFDINDKVKDKDAFIVTYCRSGGRGALSAKTLRELGYKNATNLKGGLKGWAKAGFIVKTGIGITKITEE